MNTATPPTPPAPPAGPARLPRPASRRPRIAAGVAVAVTAVAITTVALSGRGSPPDPVAAPEPPAYSGPITPVHVADGCLGGAGPEAGALGNPDLSQVVLAAQKAAPITAKGAAEFTAAIYRWAGETPRPAAWSTAARQILAPAATAAARKALAPVATSGTTSRADFNDGRYVVDSFVAGGAGGGTRAVISWVAALHATGTEPPDAIIHGAAHLVAVGEVWRFQDQSAGRPLEELQRAGTPYAGGC